MIDGLFDGFVLHAGSDSFHEENKAVVKRVAQAECESSKEADRRAEPCDRLQFSAGHMLWTGILNLFVLTLVFQRSNYRLQYSTI